MRKILSVACSVALLSFQTLEAQQAEKPPRLVVQIVAGGLRADYPTRFGHNFAEGGLRLMSTRGVDCVNARYGYAGNNTPAGLTTLATGADPADHGMVADRWLDYTTNETIRAAADPAYYGLGSMETAGQYAPTRLTTSTIGDELKRRHAASRVVSVALEPTSAVLGGGTSADAAYWFDPQRGNWCSSTYYMERLPVWVENFNDARSVDTYNQKTWDFFLLPSQYVYGERSEINRASDRRAVVFSLDRLFRRRERESYAKLQLTPAGVDLMVDFVKQTIVYESLGKDDQPDLLTVVVDPPRTIAETYGTEAMETEDALYRLDAAVAELIRFTEAEVGRGNVLFVLTADHGMSDTRRAESRAPGGAFNVMQFRVLINGFLNTQYGQGEWVMDYAGGNLYLNHRLIFERGVKLAEMQAQAAAFALQFRGVGHAVTGNALQNNYFAGGTLQKIQRGYHPKHSGDVVVSLMPGWIEEEAERVSATGSVYEYDLHVPLLWYGAGVRARTIQEPVSPGDVAPTLARILNVNLPDAATGEVIPITSPQP